MLVAFSDLPDRARLWTFAASRPLSGEESRPFLAAVDDFLVGWTAHKVPLATARDWRFDRFLFVGVDEAAAGASGCSIDALVRFVRQMEQSLGVALTDNGPVLYRSSRGAIERVSRPEFQDLASRGVVNRETIVFDNTIETAGALREGRWETPARSSWHARTFF